MPAVRAVAAAVAFLTRVPVGLELDARDLARGSSFFPLVGAGIGAVVGGIARGLTSSLTAPVAALLGLAAGTALTGVLHLDGLADTADAFGATTRERALEIMRDHAVGAYGTVAVVLDLGLKAAALAVLASRHDALRYAVCATAAARAVPVMLSAALPYARTSGTGNVLGTTGLPRVLIAIAIAVALALVLHAPIVLAAAGGAVLIVGPAARRALGGVTGDVLGAAAELCEVGALVAAIAVT